MAYFSRGLSYNLQGDYELAIADFTKVIELDPSNTDAYNERGIAHTGLGQFDLASDDYNKAMADYKKEIELVPNNPTLYYDRGLAYVRKGEHDMAVADFTKAIELDPSYADAYFARGLSYAEKYVTIIESTELGGPAVFIQANLNANEKQEVSKAISDLEQFIELSDNAELVDRAQLILPGLYIAQHGVEEK